MITVPGWLYILLAGIAIALLGALHGLPARASTARVFGWLAASIGVVLAVLSLLVAVSE